MALIEFDDEFLFCSDSGCDCHLEDMLYEGVYDYDPDEEI
ncbi:hypothetical protein Ntsu_65300 [Nocardia sp. IFM 10818]